MKTAKLLSICLTIVLVFSLCSMTAAAKSSSDSGVTITFYKKPYEGSGSGSSGSSGGTDVRDTDRRSSSTGTVNIGDEEVPLVDTVTILDPGTPLTSLPQLPKTGGNMLIPLLLVVAGSCFLFTAKNTKHDNLRPQTIT